MLQTLSEFRVLSSSGARPILYPSCVVGSYGHDIGTEWHFLTLHCLHLGLIQSCTRFTVDYTALEYSFQTSSNYYFFKCFVNTEGIGGRASSKALRPRGDWLSGNR